MKVLVTGGAGFIGSHTVDALLEKGHDVRILDNLQKPVHLKGKPEWVPEDAEFVLGDVRDKSAWERCLKGVDAVYHFAAYQDYLPDFSTFFHVNSVGTALLYEVAVEKKMDLARVVVASSQFVQGEGLYACPACRGRRTEGQVKDEHRTPARLASLPACQELARQTGESVAGRSNIEHRTSNKKNRGSEDESATLTADKKVSERGVDQESRITNQQITNNKSTDNAAKRCGVFGGVMRAEHQLKRGAWEMLCPECGGPGEWQWTPETHVAPPNAYAMAKYSQEIQAMTFGRRYQIPSVALRYSIVQGPRQSFYNAYSGACRIFSLNYYFGKAPTIYEDGMQCRDFVNIHDVVKANILALENDRMNYEVFNVGGGKAYTVREFAQIVREQMSEVRSQKSEKLPDPNVPGLYRFGDTRNACSDITKIKALGWKPQYSPEQSVREYVDWLYEQDNVEDILEFAERTMNKLGVVRSTY